MSLREGIIQHLKAKVSPRESFDSRYLVTQTPVQIINESSKTKLMSMSRLGYEILIMNNVIYPEISPSSGGCSRPETLHPGVLGGSGSSSLELLLYIIVKFHLISSVL